MDFFSFNIDEILYRIHVHFMDPLFGFITLRWIRNSDAADAYNSSGVLGQTSGGGDGFLANVFGSDLFRVFNSRPSSRKDSLEEYLNPTDERGFFEYFFDILFGRSDHESIFSLLFTTVFGWFVLLALLALLFWWLFERKWHFLSEQEKVIYDMAYKREEKVVANDKATRWQKILDLVNSDSENNWKIAIMDADIMLDEVLQEQGYTGAGVGDRLKQVGPEFSSTVQFAWEAHKVRNSVAHNSAFELSAREARKTISLYERFFSAFYHT